MKPVKNFIFLLFTIGVQGFINWTFKDFLIVGIIPALIFGAIWNMNNGTWIYNHLDDADNFDLYKFKKLTIWGIVYLIVYMILLNIFLWPNDPNDTSLGKTIFLFVGMLTSLFPLYILYYNISFVARGLSELYNDVRLKVKVVLSLIFFPIGIIWIDYKLEYLKNKH